MITPTIVYKLLQFYAIGNTPPASHVRTHPQSEDAAVLCLGSGDARHILFTAYTEQGLPPRKIDITCSDYMYEIIVRNVILLSFLIDGLESNADYDKLWNIYYHLYLDEDSLEFLEAQISKLNTAAASLQTWRDSSYGKVLRFADAFTFADVQGGLAKYTTAIASKGKASYTRSFKTYVSDIVGMRKKMFSEVPLATGYRSAAPAAEVIDGVPDQFDSYWRTGTCNASTSLLPINIPNPMFAATISETVLLHHGVNPTLGFHLAPGFVGLAEGSPLKMSADDKLPGRDQLAKMAQLEFRAMAKAFQARQEFFTVRFTTAEALSFSYTLQNCSSSGRSELTANWYRRQMDARPLVLDATEYTTNEAPVVFDVVEMSTMSDHLGVLNLLLAAVPVLRDAPSSTIHMETLVHNSKVNNESFATLLCGDTLTLSLLLGITPAEYYTNTRTTSSFDEAASTNAEDGSLENINKQLRTHLSWKLAHQFGGYAGNTAGSNKIKVTAAEVYAVLLSTYKDMFFYEDLDCLRQYTGGGSSRMTGRRMRVQFPLYHRGSFAALVRVAMDRVDTEWPTVLQKIYDMMEAPTEDPLDLGTLHLAEFKTHLQLYGVQDTGEKIVSVTFVVPRADIKGMFKGSVMSQASSPIFSVELLGGADGDDDGMDDTPQVMQHYDDIQVMFGTLSIHGEHGSHDFRLAVAEDSKGWHGKSPMVVTFNTTMDALAAAQDNGMVMLQLHSNARCLKLVFDPRHEDIGNPLICGMQLSDQLNVFVSPYTPGMQGLAKIAPPVFSPVASRIENLAHTDISATIDAKGKVSTVTGHVSIDSEQGKKLLQDALVSIKVAAGPSPYIVNIVFGSNNDLIVPVQFTVPVAASKAKTRIARKSLWIEVIVPLALPAQSPCLEGMVYPAVLDAHSRPVTLTCPHINLDVQPVIDLGIADRGALMWLPMSTSLTFSRRESEMRDLIMSQANNKLGVSASLRFNIKETIYSMIQITSGLQDGSTGLIALMHPSRGGIHMLIVVSALRMDLHSGSVAIDAAVLPFTKPVLAKAGMQAFLALTQRMEVRTVNVDDAELAAWKSLLPALAERCRTWQHKESCEYLTAHGVPISLEDGESAICSCGEGQVPADFVSMPLWEEARPYATRVAITPLFCSNEAEEPSDPALQTRASHQAAQSSIAPKDQCRVCGARHGSGGPSDKLKACARCKRVFYCSAACQKADWKTHKKGCQ